MGIRPKGAMALPVVRAARAVVAAASVVALGGIQPHQALLLALAVVVAATVVGLPEVARGRVVLMLFQTSAVLVAAGSGPEVFLPEAEGLLPLLRLPVLLKMGAPGVRALPQRVAEQAVVLARDREVPLALMRLPVA
jgi:hypothetical protein